MKNTPLAVMISKPDPSATQQEGQSYAQYLTTMRQQINYAKEIHDLLHDSATKLMEKFKQKTATKRPQNNRKLLLKQCRLSFVSFNFM